MSSQSVPAVFGHLKNYIRLAEDHDGRDSLIAYRSRLFAAQRAMDTENKSDEERRFLSELIDRLEKDKAQLSSDKELLSNEEALRQYIEQYTLKLFLYADDQEKAGRCDRIIVRMFFSVGLLFDICESISPLDDQTQHIRKVARCKAAQMYSSVQRPNETNRTVATVFQQNAGEDKFDSKDIDLRPPNNTRID